MAIKDLIVQNRTYRKFHEDQQIEKRTLLELVDLARLSASSGNMQPLKYMLSVDPLLNAKIFSTLAWAGYLTDWPGPKEGERPSAYIIMLLDTRITKTVESDHGIACQSITLGAAEKGMGACIIGSIKRPQLTDILSIEPHFKILYVIALGKPKERVKLEDVGLDGSIRYWRDEDGLHHVPKRSLEEIVIE